MSSYLVAARCVEGVKALYRIDGSVDEARMAVIGAHNTARVVLALVQPVAKQVAA